MSEAHLPKPAADDAPEHSESAEFAAKVSATGATVSLVLPRATSKSLALIEKNVPPELRALSAWVVGDRSPKTMSDGTSKSSKAPIDPKTGRAAKTSDSTTWGTFDEALQRAATDERAFGIGINLPGSDLLGLDLDDVIDLSTGKVIEPAAKLIASLPATYIERSPSGRGLRLFFRGKKPSGLECSVLKDVFGDGADLEVYDGDGGGRYLSFTGDILTERPHPIATVEDHDLAPLIELQQCKYPKRKPLLEAPRTQRRPTQGDHMQAKNANADPTTESCGRSVLDNDIARATWGLIQNRILDPDAGYGTWFRVGAALKEFGEVGLDLWIEFSRASKAFDEAEIRDKWPGIAGSSIASLFGMFDDADPTWRTRCQIDDAPLPSSDDTNLSDEYMLLGSRDPKTGKLVLSPKKTLPTAKAFVEEFYSHPSYRTLHDYAGVLVDWDGNRYTEVERGFLRKKTLQWLHDALRPVKDKKGNLHLVDFESNPSTVSAALDSIQDYIHLPATVVAPSWLNGTLGQHPANEILSCRTKNVHIPTGTVFAPSPAFFNFNALSFDYDPSASAPSRWLEFLSQIFGDDIESIDLLRQWFGYCLINDTSQQKMLLIVGPKRSGKGTIARVLRELIGVVNVVNPTISGLAGTFGLQPLIGKSLAIISDARFAREHVMTVVERLLCISGEDASTIDRKYLGAVTMKLLTRFVLLTNELPRFPDASGALAGRFLVLRLMHSFYGRENIDLTDELLAELPGILNWAIEGWRELHAKGRFTEPESSRELFADIEDLSSPVGAFVREMCAVGPKYRVKTSALFDAWWRWRGEEDPMQDGTRQAFGRDLSAAVPGVRRRRSTGKRSGFYEGITLKCLVAGGESDSEPVTVTNRRDGSNCNRARANDDAAARMQGCGGDEGEWEEEAINANRRDGSRRSDAIDEGGGTYSSSPRAVDSATSSGLGREERRQRIRSFEDVLEPEGPTDPDEATIVSEEVRS